MPLTTDIISARVVLYPGTKNEWYEVGMNGGTLNYNVTSGGG